MPHTPFALGLLSLEPFTCCDTPPPPELLHALMAVCDVFSPNEAEAVSMVGPGPPEQLVGRLIEAGADVVALRRGPEGAMISSRDSGELLQVRGERCGGFLSARMCGCGPAQSIL